MRSAGSLAVAVVVALVLGGCAGGASAHDLAQQACDGVDLDGRSYGSGTSSTFDPTERAAEIQEWVDSVSAAAELAAQAAARESRYSDLVEALTQVETQTLALQRLFSAYGMKIEEYNERQLAEAQAWSDDYERARTTAFAQCRIVAAD